MGPMMFFGSAEAFIENGIVLNGDGWREVSSASLIDADRMLWLDVRWVKYVM